MELLSNTNAKVGAKVIMGDSFKGSIVEHISKDSYVTIQWENVLHANSYRITRLNRRRKIYVVND